MRPKLIGVTARFITENNVLKEFVNHRYLTPLHKRGFNTIMLTTNNPNLETILELCDGFLITGGADINPKYFNEENAGLSKNVSDELDELDRQVVLHAKKYKKPLLGICRGHQAINVFLGGSLYQDIGPTHDQEPRYHKVKTTKNRLLDFPEEILVNSYHHQAIKDVAPDMDVIAIHDDNTIEAIIHKTLPIFSVQWHPEINPDSRESEIIFDTFANLFN
ncbi:MAG TPA: type 1 glutamine amidotransferase [Bacilli bacterium]|nr:type 1 glutamine amidotransferase [Bacilli bacterium]